MSQNGTELVEKNESRIDNLFALFERLNNRPDHTDEVQLLMDRVTQLEAEVASLTEQVRDNSKLSSVDAIVEAARNKADPTMSAVVLTAKELRIATGVSSSHAYRYLDDLPDEFDYFSARSDEDKQRGLVVHLDHVKQVGE